MKQFFYKNKMLISVIAIIVYFLIIYALNIKLSFNNVQITGAIVIALVITFMNFYTLKKFEKSKKIDYKKIIIAIGIIGIVLRTVYILYTPLDERQHDMEKKSGHLAYIETIYDTGKLPTTNKWQFYQQPLHHIIAACWLKINTKLGVDFDIAKDGIKILTAIYSSLIILTTYAILKELNVKNKIKVLIMLIIAVHPTFIILSGSVNNDILMIMFTFLGLLYLIKWNKNPSIKNTVILAIVTALIALSKISGTIIAIPILYIFINRFFKDYFSKKDKKVLKEYLIKFTLFGIISLSLGLSYSIRNLIKFDQSIFYVPKAGEAVYCGDRDIFERINIFSKEWLKVFCFPYNDCNILSYLIRSSIFGEYHLDEENGYIISYVLLVFNVILIILSIISLIYIIFKKEKKIEIKMLILFYFTELIMYIYSNFSMPYGCTMDFRYVVPTIFLGMIFIEQAIENKAKNYYNGISCITILFSICAVIFELTYMQYLYV